VKQLARSGAHVIVGARNGGRRAALAAEMRAQPGARVDVLPLDIASASSVVTFAASVEKLLAGRRLDGLCNNAAVIKCSEQRTAAGLEMTFATNALGPFHLTNCLLPLLSKGEGGERARVVNVGSRLESRGWIDPKALLEHGDMHALPQSAPKPAAMMVSVPISLPDERRCHAVCRHLLQAPSFHFLFLPFYEEIVRDSLAKYRIFCPAENVCSAQGVSKPGSNSQQSRGSRSLLSWRIIMSIML
jgi:hypothetical protein